MGYSTDFVGEAIFDKALEKDFIEYINEFSRSRHMTYDLEALKLECPWWRINSFNGDAGKDGCYLVKGEHNFRQYITDYNRSGECPGLWCDWSIFEQDGYSSLRWNGSEKFYNYTEWLEFLIEHFFKKEDLNLSGFFVYLGEDRGDAGYIIIDNNIVICKYHEDVTKEELCDIYKENVDLVRLIEYHWMGIADIDEYYSDRYNYC